MKKPIRILAAGAAFCFTLNLTACAGRVQATLDSLFRAVSPVQPTSSDATPAPDTSELPENAKNVEGLVLDASGGLLILRAVEGPEYVFRMDGAQDRVEGGTAAGQFVRVWYSGTLEDTNARNVKVLCIEAAQETQPDTYDMGCMAEGSVVSLNDWRITIRTAAGQEYSFMAGENVRAVEELTEGMWVRIYFDGTPSSAVVSRVAESVGAADIFSIVGTLRSYDEEANTVTLQADGGGSYTFDTSAAEIIAPDGIWAGTRRYVAYYRGTAAPKNTEHAILLRLCMEKQAGEQTLQGVVCAVQEKRGTFDVCTADGRVINFPMSSVVTRSQDGVQAGDGVSITYFGSISETRLYEVEFVSLAVRSASGANETSVLGEVYGVTDRTLTLSAADGRMLQFRLPEGKQFPERMAKGDTVRVSYTGWIAGDDTSTATYTSAVRAYA